AERLPTDGNGSSRFMGRWRGSAGRAGPTGLTPEVTPAVVVNDLHPTLAQDIEAGRVTIRLPVIDARDVGVDGHLGAHHTWRSADEHDLAGQLGAGFDQGVLLTVEAATGSGGRRIAAVGQAAGVAVVADAQDLGEICGGDDGADLE